MVWPSVRLPYATGRCCAIAVVISRPAATRFFTAPPEPPLPWLDRTGGLPCAGASARLVGVGHARPFCEPNVSHETAAGGRGANAETRWAGLEARPTV